MPKTFDVPREEGFEEVMDTLVTRITGIEHFKHHTGCYFTNETFELRPYYFGKCLCAYGKALENFLTINPHKDSCFHTELKILNDAFKNHPQYLHNNKLKAERANEERRLCTAHNIHYKDGKNLDDICNCGALEKFGDQGYSHEERCPKLLPNFIFIPEHLGITWYKTYFRDSTSTQHITLEDFKRIIGICLSSI